MKRVKNDRIKLHEYIFRMQLIMVIVLAVTLGIVGIYVNLHEESAQRDLNLQNVAEAIAHSDPVALANEGEESSLLIDYLDSLKESLADVDVISVVGQDNIRLYHSNHNLIGTVFDGTMPDFEHSGKYYMITENGPSGVTRRAYAAIYSQDGELSGFVMAIMLMSNIRSKNIRILLIFIAIMMAAIIIEFFISLFISKKIRKSLKGYEPDTFSEMFNVRENILESLNEGIIAADEGADVQFINKAARNMLQIGGEDSSQQDICRNLLMPTIEKGEKDVSVPLNLTTGLDIIIDRIPISENGKTIGAVGILHDRTEYTKLAEDLAGTRFLVDSMRANNHDFTNKLHVILGLLQMEMYDQAVNYIQDITLVQRETISEIMHKVNSPAIAALLIGKNSRASELNIKYMFRKDSSYNCDDISVPEEALITIIGNLLDNGLEALNSRTEDRSGKDQPRELWVGIYSKKKTLLITVDDTGPGIQDEDAEHIFEDGFSTKGPGRGTGLFQAKRLAEAYGGSISVSTQPGKGTSFTVSFVQEEPENV